MLPMCVSQNQFSPAPESFGMHSAFRRDCRTLGRENFKGAAMAKTLKQRFDSKVDKNGPIPKHATYLGKCWQWKGTKGSGSHQYGKLSFSQQGKKRRYLRAHRVAYSLHSGPIASSVLVLHRCDNPRCVNPNHLFIGTPADNMNDAASKLRLAKKLTPASVVQIRYLYKIGNHTMRTLGAMFSVCPAVIFAITHKKIWNHNNL